MASVAPVEEAPPPPVAPSRAAANALPVGTLDPQLFMAACCGDNNLLKELLRLDEGRVVVQVEPPLAPSSGAAASGSLHHQLLQLDAVTGNEGDSLLHVVAARGSGDGGRRFLDCAKTIYRGNNGLLAARNNKGDTPLHRAAAAGSAGMVSCLVALKTAEAEVAGGDMTAVKEFLRMRNNCGETALHQAVRAASKACIDELLLVDPSLATTVPLEGEEGASPFYLAFSLGEVNIARHLFDENNGQLSYSGPDGQNVLHAAVSRGQALPTLLEWLKDLTVDVQQGSVPLVSHLAQKRDKQTGSTPLHLAASLEGWPCVGILSKWFPNVWPRPKPAVALLLDANTCAAAYQPDAEGLYPIHVAALADSLDAVRVILERCPDCATLRDARGRTFLHVAVEAEAYRVVEYACRRMHKELPPVILNMQDNNGDTALHRAVHVGNLPVFNCLIRNRRVHLNIPNKDALTPYDLSWVRIPSSFYYDMILARSYI
ncbi:protein ACCELERATED CELL DEATH 6-like [Setaria italica]|uniref:protein ACCELERATED CELL DEATH 6-like n=1 Tax=Setaria italica TaxID=4555 RepID=UPI000BE5FB6D|nr:protein ACCELERATED CELL DEATH 6-like [Setaria italica]